MGKVRLPAKKRAGDVQQGDHRASVRLMDVQVAKQGRPRLLEVRSRAAPVRTVQAASRKGGKTAMASFSSDARFVHMVEAPRVERVPCVHFVGRLFMVKKTDESKGTDVDGHTRDGRE